MKVKTDVLIIGGGPGGAAATMFLLREGIKPIVLEQEAFPRFHIGESMTGEAGQLLRRLGLEKPTSFPSFPPSDLIASDRPQPFRQREHFSLTASRLR